MENPTIHPDAANLRVAPISIDELRPEWKATLERIPGSGLKGTGFPSHVLRQLMHRPELFGPFLEWWVTAKSAMALSPREQELAIADGGKVYNLDGGFLAEAHFADMAAYDSVMVAAAVSGWNNPGGMHLALFELRPLEAILHPRALSLWSSWAKKFVCHASSWRRLISLRLVSLGGTSVERKTANGTSTT
ncbi:MAG: hypothetical protein WCI38_01140 [Chthoniobacterales bacterium]|jgi:hypothetical protein